MASLSASPYTRQVIKTGTLIRKLNIHENKIYLGKPYLGRYEENH